MSIDEILDELDEKSGPEIRFDAAAHLAELLEGCDASGPGYAAWLEGISRMPEPRLPESIDPVQHYLEQNIPAVENMQAAKRVIDSPAMRHYAAFCSDNRDAQDLIYLAQMEKDGYGVPLVSARPSTAAAAAFAMKKAPEWENEIKEIEKKLSALGKTDTAAMLKEKFSYVPGIAAAGGEEETAAALETYAAGVKKEYEAFARMRRLQGLAALKPGDRVVIEKTRGGFDRYHYGGSIRRVPLGTEAEVVHAGADEVDVRLPERLHAEGKGGANRWSLHPDEIMKMQLKSKDPESCMDEITGLVLEGRISAGKLAAASRDFREGDEVVIEKALRGTKYKHGISINDIPPGTRGNVCGFEKYYGEPVVLVQLPPEYSHLHFKYGKCRKMMHPDEVVKAARYISEADAAAVANNRKDPGLRSRIRRAVEKYASDMDETEIAAEYREKCRPAVPDEHLRLMLAGDASGLAYAARECAAAKLRGEAHRLEGEKSGLAARLERARDHYQLRK